MRTAQVMGVLDAMPNSNLKPEAEDAALDANRVYRTTYMFSATMPPAVERLARKYLRRPVVINIGSAGKATDLVLQRVYILKVPLLLPCQPSQHGSPSLYCGGSHASIVCTLVCIRAGQAIRVFLSLQLSCQWCLMPLQGLVLLMLRLCSPRCKVLHTQLAVLAYRPALSMRMHSDHANAIEAGLTLIRVAW